MLDVVLTGNLTDTSGYARVNRNLYNCLKRKKYNVCANNLSKKNDVSFSFLSSELANFRKSIGIDSIIPSMNIASPCKYKILYTTVETNTLPKNFLHSLNNYHEIWTTSDYCKHVISQYTDQQIEVIPNILEVDHFYEKNQYVKEIRSRLKSFVFLSVFNWSYRKGYDALIKAFVQSFSAEDDVSLFLVTRSKTKRNDQIHQEIRSIAKRYAKKSIPDIKMCPSIIDEKSMPLLYNSCDAFVMPSRGEGFGYPFAEASLCGLPVIATNHGGQTMFLNQNNSSLIDVDAFEKLSPGIMDINFWDNQFMPKLKSKKFIKDFIEALKNVYENYQIYKEKNVELQEFIKNNYSIDQVSNIINQRLKNIADKV